MFNINTKPNTNTDPNNVGVYNQFVSPIATEEDAPKKDFIKIFLLIVLFIVLFIAIGSFVYANILKNQVAEKKLALENYDKMESVVSFKTNLISMRELSGRLKLLNSVFDNKLYVSSVLFPIIESLTESTRDSYVYFDKFNLKKGDKDKIVSVSLSGVAIDYHTLYRQMKNFRENPYSKYISNIKLNNMSLEDKTGNVLFDLGFDIDISSQTLLEYLDKSTGKKTQNISNASSTFIKTASSTASSTNVSTSTQRNSSSTLQNSSSSKITP